MRILPSRVHGSWTTGFLHGDPEYRFRPCPGPGWDLAYGCG